MKTLALTIGAAAVLLPFILFIPGVVASDKDHLFQIELAEFPKSRAILLSKLGPTRFDCGRVVFKPAFSPEYSVSTYSGQPPGDKTKGYFVTYIKAEQNLNDLFEPGIDPKQAQAVKTSRIDCEIPKQTAEKLRDAWIGMLSGEQRPIPIREEDATRATDTTVAEFSIQESNRETLYGELLEAELPQGPKTKALVDLANSLVGYCNARPSDRPTIASQVDRKATRLLEILKHVERK